MKADTAEQVVEYIKNQGLVSDFDHDDLKVIEDYSGRGMYGKTTAAIEAPGKHYLGVIGYAIAMLRIDRREIPDSMDNMGYNYVYY